MREVPKSGPLVLKGGSADPRPPPWLRAWEGKNIVALTFYAIPYSDL